MSSNRYISLRDVVKDLKKQEKKKNTTEKIAPYLNKDIWNFESNITEDAEVVSIETIEKNKTNERIF